MREGRPSQTAKKIALGQLLLARDPALAPLLPDGAVRMTRDLLEAAGVLRRWEVATVESRWYRALANRVIRLSSPGWLAHLAIRKRYIDERVRTALASGTEQVLVLGAGYDTLCARQAPAHPEALFLELDHPATSRVKQRGVGALGAARANLRLEAVDLARRPLLEVLAELPCWHAGRRSIVVAEGLLMYLTEEAVTTLLASLVRSMDSSSRLVMTYLRRDERGRLIHGPLAGAIRWGLRLLGEPVQWGVAEGALGPFLEARGFELLDAPAPGELAARYLEPAGLRELPLPDLERFAEAQAR